MAMKMHRPTWKLLLALSFCGVLLLMTVCYALRSGKNPSYRLSVKQNVVTVDYGELVSGYEEMRFIVPLHLLDLSPGSVKAIKPTCKCTVAEVKPDDKEINIVFKPSSGTVNVSKTIKVVPYGENAQLRFIRLVGKLKAAWLPRPRAVKLEKVRPGERRRVSADVQLNYDAPDIRVDAAFLKPEAEGVALDTNIDDGSVTIDITTVGSNEAHVYKGTIVLVFGASPYKQFELPLEVHHLGTLSAIPRAVTLTRDNGDNLTTVALQHFESTSLTISKIESPAYIKVVSLGCDKGRCLLGIGPATDRPTLNSIMISKILVHFDEIETVGVVHVIVMPSVKSPPQDGMGAF